MADPLGNLMAEEEFGLRRKCLDFGHAGGQLMDTEQCKVGLMPSRWKLGQVPFDFPQLLVDERSVEF